MIAAPQHHDSVVDRLFALPAGFLIPATADAGAGPAMERWARALAQPFFLALFGITFVRPFAAAGGTRSAAGNKPCAADQRCGQALRTRP